uniref:Conotoxin Cl6d n=1 Tax=Californiconus californicus TaxID=1736779 RepID=U6D_CONCL|nr:RecName: Full=Conotoxin Cl6d; AltName: Full=Cal6.17b [Californiconus californicus]
GDACSLLNGDDCGPGELCCTPSGDHQGTCETSCW